MGRIGRFFKKVGRGLGKAMKWAGKNLLKPAVKIAANPIVGELLNKVKPGIGTGVNGIAAVVDSIIDRPKAAPAAPK
jgi:hypothetical protein